MMMLMLMMVDGLIKCIIYSNLRRVNPKRALTVHHTFRMYEIIAIMDLHWVVHAQHIVYRLNSRDHCSTYWFVISSSFEVSKYQNYQNTTCSERE